MKVIIQIPCFNEEDTLPLVFEKMPKSLQGVDVLEFQIIDDGSTDETVSVARDLGVHHIVSYRGKNRRWLGRAFKVGVEHALMQGADIVVNTDGDNQYPSDKIQSLIDPILNGEAEIVIGDRRTHTVTEFSFVKKILQKIGSRAAQLFSGGQVLDAVSGFRAYSREALAKINIVTNYTYTVDTLIQANKKGLDIVWLPIQVNKKTRESRLIKNLWTKVIKSGSAILRLYSIYEPLKTFLLIGLPFVLVGFGLLVRFMLFYLQGEGDGNIQSVVIGSIALVIGVQIFSLGILAELISVNRRIIEDIRENQKLRMGRE